MVKSAQAPQIMQALQDTTAGVTRGKQARAAATTTKKTTTKKTTTTTTKSTTTTSTRTTTTTTRTTTTIAPYGQCECVNTTYK